MDILRHQSQIADASTAALVATYNALTGKSIARFSSRGAGESQVANAIMAAQDRAGHAGVAKGATPEAKTEAEIATKAPSAAAPVGSPKPLREKLAAKAGAASPHKAKAQPARAPREKSAAIVAVAPTGAGESKLQVGSERAAVFNEIVRRHGEGCRVVTVAELNAHFGRDTRGFIGKLLEKHHLIAVSPA